MATQLEMGPQALAKVRTPRAIYCRVCRTGHIVEGEDLWLGSDVPGVHPLAGTTWAGRLDGAAFADAGDPRHPQRRSFDVSGEPVMRSAPWTPRREGVSPR